MEKLNQITLFAKECPKCGKNNPEKHITFDNKDSVEDKEIKKKNAMKCSGCGYDIYEHDKKELDK